MIVVFPDHTHLLFEAVILFVVVDILFYIPLFVCGGSALIFVVADILFSRYFRGFCVCLCFGMHNFVSFIILHSS